MLFSFSLREKAGMRAIIKFMRLRLHDPLTLAFSLRERGLIRGSLAELCGNG